jgi:hypothetical protein
MHIQYLWESQKERHHWDDQQVGGRIRTELIWRRHGPAEGSRVHGNELRIGEFLNTCKTAASQEGLISIKLVISVYTDHHLDNK